MEMPWRVLSINVSRSDVLIGIITQASDLLRWEDKSECGSEASNCSVLLPTKERWKLIFTFLSPGFLISVTGTSIHPVDQVRNLDIFLTSYLSLTPCITKTYKDYIFSIFPKCLFSPCHRQVDIIITLSDLLTGLPAFWCSPSPRRSPSHSQSGLCKMQTYPDAA